MKKYIFLLAFLLISTPAWAANKYAITGGGNWSGATWATASNQAVSDTSAPTTSDTAFLDAYSGNVTVDTTTCTANLLNATGYTGTLTYTAGQKLTIRSTTTLAAGMTIAGTGTHEWGYSSTASTLTTGGQTFTGDFTFAGTGAKTIVGNLTINGMMNQTGTSNIVGSGYSVYLNGGSTTGSYYFNDLATNPDFYLQGGTYSGYLPNVANCYINGDVTWIPDVTAGNYLLSVREGIGLKYLSGTITHTDSTVYGVALNGVGVWDLQGQHVFNRLRPAGGTLTMSSDFTVTDLGGASSGWTINGGTISILTNLGCYGTTTYSGTGTLKMIGTGSMFTKQVWPSLGGSTYAGANNINLNVTIDTTGTITFAPSPSVVTWGGATDTVLKYVAGTLVTTNLDWNIAGNYTFDIDMLCSNFDVSTVGAVVTFLSDFDVTTYRQVEGTTVVIARGKTFTVNGTEFYISGSNTAYTYFKSSGNIDSVTGLGLTGVIPYEATAGSVFGTAGVWSALTTTMAAVNFGDTYTIAFDMYSETTATVNILYLSNAIRIQTDVTPRLAILTNAIGNKYSYATLPTMIGWHRYVITKLSADAGFKMYQDGTLLTITAASSCVGEVFNGITKIGNTSTMKLGSIVAYSDVKDQAWVTADYSRATEYTGAEANCTHLWRFIPAYLTTSTTYAQQRVYKCDFTNIDASGSTSKPIYTWHGSAAACNGVVGVTGENIKTLAYASA